VASNCTRPNKCSTSFPGPTGLGGSFNRSLWKVKGQIFSVEQRAFRNLGEVRLVGPTEGIGLTAFGPNLNIIRDPRFGRNSELPSEDPFLTGELGKSMVRGMQEHDSLGRPRTLAFVKHFTAYSLETDRTHGNNKISKFDLADTYLRQYEMVFRQSKPAGAMCSYNAINGHPSCANGHLLNHILRKQWNQPDAIITSDCGAISFMSGPPLNEPDVTMRASFGINNGTDLEMGSDNYRSGLTGAIKNGTVSEAQLTVSVRRLLKGLFKVGVFDRFPSSDYDRLGWDDINSTASQQAVYDASLQSVVLLRNDVMKGGRALLPLRKGSENMVATGPFIEAMDEMFSDYQTNPPCFYGAPFSCVQTFLDSVNIVNGKEIKGVQGIDLKRKNASNIDDAVQAAKQANIVFLAVGTPKLLEHEGKDRNFTDLPPDQQELVDKILALKKPTVVVLFNGGAVSADSIALSTSPLAIIEAFNPNRAGMRGLADLMFGVQNKWGKLPYTIYPSSYQHEVDLMDFDMAKSPGRTYRFYEGKPLWHFGSGLSYTTFESSKCTCVGGKVSCYIVNQGETDGDEVVQLYYHPDPVLHAHHQRQPKQVLVGFERISVRKGERSLVIFRIDPAVSFLTTYPNGDRKVCETCTHKVSVALGTKGGSGDENRFTCTMYAGGLATVA